MPSWTNVPVGSPQSGRCHMAKFHYHSYFRGNSRLGNWAISQIMVTLCRIAKAAVVLIVEFCCAKIAYVKSMKNKFSEHGTMQEQKFF